MRIRPLLWSNNGGVRPQPPSALGARGVPHHLSGMLASSARRRAPRRRVGASPVGSARPGLAAGPTPRVHRGERSGGSGRDVPGGRRPLTSLGGPAPGSARAQAAPPAAPRPAHGPRAPAAARREDRA